MIRLLALVILLIPILLAALGIKLMRDMIFGILQAPIPSLSLQFIVGLFLFLIGIGFIGGFILYRDRKKSRVQGRFKRRNNIQK